MTRLLRHWLLLLVVSLFALANGAVCQPYYFTHYQVENGLSNNAVMCSLQDRQGFMWFGTRDGLNRFDGLTFKIFRTDPTDSGSIGSNSITCLYEDESGRIWAGTEKGLFQYDGRTETFTQLKAVGNYSIRDVKVVGANVWYISLFTLNSFNEKTGRIKTFKTDKEVSSYCITKDGTLWIATPAGTVAQYDPLRDTFREYNVFEHSPYAVSKWIEVLFDTGKGMLLVGTANQGLKSFDISSGTYKDVLLFDTDGTGIIVRDIIAASNDAYWIATQSGIFILHIKGGGYIQLIKELTNPYSLSDNIVHTLCKDREGGIWAGTYFGGINYYPKQYITFKKYFPQPGTNAMSGSAVREICGDADGNLWIGTEDAGLNKLNPRTDTFKNFKTTSATGSVSYSNIHGLLVSGNEVWAGTYLNGLDVLDAKTGKRIRHYTTSNSGIGSNFIYSLFKDGANTLFVATDKGLYRYETQRHDFALITWMPKVFYRTLWEDRNGTLWAGTYGDGVFYHNAKTGAHGQFTSQAGDTCSLPTNLINKIFEDADRTLWFATEGGLCRYNEQKNHFDRFTTADGFPSDVVYAMLEDNSRNLWVSTSKGLVRFSPRTKALKTFTKAHGLLTNQFNYSSAYKAADGRMYFGSVNGLVSFHPDSIQETTYSPPVYLTGFQVYNRELLIGKSGSPLKTSITYTNSVTLPYNQSSFSIDFAALSYTAPGTIQYAYKMEGLDKNWTHLQTNRRVYFTELAPGTYTFNVRAMDGNRSHYGTPAVLQIKILPPLWKTTWAYGLYFIAVAALGYAIILFFINRSRERNRRKLEKLEYEKERENYKDKIQFFTNVAHEIRTPLTLIKGPLENIMDRADELPAIKKSLEIMDRNTDRLLRLSTQLLDFRKVEMNGFRLNFTKQNLSELLCSHQQNFEALAQQQRLNFATHFPDAFYACIDVEAFNKIISNLWDNAVKYAQTAVSVSLKPVDETDREYQIIFKNDGHKIPVDLKEKVFESFYRAQATAQLPGTGIGLTLARSLAQLHGGSLVLAESGEPMNVFVLTLPTNPPQA